MTSPDVPVCDECGQQHLTKFGAPACIRHSSGGQRPEIRGNPCRNPPRHGQKVCGMHGGASEQALAAAAGRIEAEQVAKLASKFTDPVNGEDQDPGEIVAEQIKARYRYTRWLRVHVEALDEKSFVWGRTKKKIGGDDHGRTYEAKPNAWLVLYLEAQRELEKLCIEAIKAGLEERRVRLAETDAEQWVRFIDDVLTDLGHDPNDPATADVVERRLRVA